jgi:hypothetical protein
MVQLPASKNDITVVQNSSGLKIEINNLLTEVELARNIQIPDLQAQYICKRLIEENVTRGQLQTARAWFLKGDWSNRYSKFSYQDFFPTEKQLATISDVLVKTHEQIADIMRKEFERGIEAGRKQAAAEQAQLNAIAEPDKLISKNIELYKEIFELKRELKETRTQLTNTETALTEYQRIQHGQQSTAHID